MWLLAFIYFNYVDPVSFLSSFVVLFLFTNLFLFIKMKIVLKMDKVKPKISSRLALSIVFAILAIPIIIYLFVMFALLFIMY